MKLKYFLITILLLICTSCNTIPDRKFQIKFISDRNYDQCMIYKMFKMDDPAGLESRANSMNIDFTLAMQIKVSTSYTEIQKDLNNVVNVKYGAMEKEINNSIKKYSESWDQIIDEFSKIIQEITETKWFHNEYQCVISPFHPGISNWYGNKIVRKCGEDAIEQRRITAHEILLSQIFQICRRDFSKNQIDDWKIWEISEITTVFVLDDGRLLKFWGSYIPPANYFSSSNYPQLAELESKLKDEYKNRSSFKDYIYKAVTIAKDK